MTTLEKNIQALLSGVNEPLGNKLLNFIQTKTCSRFSMDENLNIYDKNNNIFMYENIEEEINYFYQNILEKTLRYPFICIYGIGNALLAKNLAKHYKHLFVFESEIELFILALSAVDLSEELFSGKIYLVDMKDDKMNLQLSMLFDQYGTFEWLYLYDMFTNCNYYQKYFIDFLTLANHKCLDNIELVLRENASPDFIMRCYGQCLQNIPTMLENIPFQRILSERKNKFENAIVVSAGPSLDKQLSLLKTYQEKAVIFCADGALSMLEKEGIVPDYITNLDFSDLALKFFENLESCENSVFLLAATTHPNVVNFLKNQNKALVISDTSYYKYYRLEDFGYIDTGTHVSHFSYTLALALGFKNIIMIGQDLAFDEKGNSHSKGFNFGEKFSKEENIDKVKVPAYGGKGEVLAHRIWNDYRIKLEYLFARNTQAKFYNATEGGAKINFTKELSFKECCENILQEVKPRFEIPKTLTANRSQKIFTKFKDIVQKNIQICQDFIDDASTLEQALCAIVNSNKELPLSFLYNVYKNILNFDTYLQQDKLMGDNFLKALHGYKGKCLSEVIVLKNQNEGQFLIEFIKAYYQFLKVLMLKINDRKELFIQTL
ncbi:TPA: motility associated factor glycosyltransferase family protein [Campylobacter coli]|nr:motility associated factor glycosyltransferase family protein [Campylobacter coli]HEH4989881.1 motility associated factor glycosyltransferase family protein [Campylobacter coli]HEH5122029.1 motility associated factor glycosyltransferase family protein [Campylobacter coli]HEH5453057.1 motility associated factor glycosyltransferase family protein [Campylobacter coli]